MASVLQGLTSSIKVPRCVRSWRRTRSSMRSQPWPRSTWPCTRRSARHQGPDPCHPPRPATPGISRAARNGSDLRETGAPPRACQRSGLRLAHFSFSAFSLLIAVDPRRRRPLTGPRRNSEAPLWPGRPPRCALQLRPGVPGVPVASAEGWFCRWQAATTFTVFFL